MARILLIAVIAGFIGLLGWGLAQRLADETIDIALSGGRTVAAPGFELPVLQSGDRRRLPRDVAAALGDDRLALSELRGHAVVLNFWASWCPPCRKEAPLLERGWRERPRGVIYLGLDMQDVESDARDFLREFGVTYPVVREGENTVATRYGLTGLPETYFIAPRRRVVGHVIGALSDDKLRAGLRALRSRRPVNAH